MNDSLSLTFCISFIRHILTEYVKQFIKWSRMHSSKIKWQFYIPLDMQYDISKTSLKYGWYSSTKRIIQQSNHIISDTNTWMTTASPIVSWQSTWRILAWQSLKHSDWIFSCIAYTQSKHCHSQYNYNSETVLTVDTFVTISLRTFLINRI